MAKQKEERVKVNDTFIQRVSKKGFSEIDIDFAIDNDWIFNEIKFDLLDGYAYPGGGHSHFCEAVMDRMRTRLKEAEVAKEFAS